MKHFPRAVAFALLVTVGCAKNPRSLVFTHENKEEILNEVARSESLSVEEKRLVLSYLKRIESEAGSANAAGGGVNSSLDAAFGKTVGQVLDEQKAWATLAAEKQAREDSRLEEIKKALRFSISDLKPSQLKTETGTYADITIDCENTSGRRVSAFEGHLLFFDVLGTKVSDKVFRITDPLEAGARRNYYGFIPYGDRPQLRKAGDLRLEWQPTNVLFDDATKPATTKS